MNSEEQAHTSPITLTCFVASTPWGGGWRLCRSLGRSGRIDTPRAWFDPLRIPRTSRSLSIPMGAADWAARYLEGVATAGTRDGICWVSLQWTHLRWLSQIARFALRPPLAEHPSLDSDVLAAWFPQPRFVSVGSADTASQALRWYAALHPELEAPDYQEVRWLEAVIRRQDRAWTTFFNVHGIVPQTVDYDDIVSQPAETVDAVLAAVGIATGDEERGQGLFDGPSERQAARWLKPYRTVRPRLRTTVGVRSPRP